MIEFLKSIPSTIWAVLLGAGLTLIGVLVSNMSNTKRLKIQLQHDSYEKSKERKSIVRHEVYLLAAEELVKANSYLGSLSQVDVTTTSIGAGLIGFFVSAAKLSMVADQKTARAVNDLVSLYGELIFRLMSKILPMQSIKSEIEIRNEHYNRTQSEIERILSEMRRVNESAEIDNLRFSALQRSFDFQQSEAKRIAEERNQFWQKFNNLNIEYVRALMHEMKEVSELQIPILVGIRKELDLETNEEEYRQILKSQREKINKQLEKFISNLENQNG